VAAHLDAGPTGQPGKCQAARRLSPPLSVKTTSLMGPPMVLPQPTASGGGRSAVVLVAACWHCNCRTRHPLATMWTFTKRWQARWKTLCISRLPCCRLTSALWRSVAHSFTYLLTYLWYFWQGANHQRLDV